MGLRAQRFETAGSGGAGARRLQDGTEPAAHAAFEGQVDGEALPGLKHPSLTQPQGVCVQPGEGPGGELFAGGGQPWHRFEHPVQRFGWPALEHFVPPLLDRFPSHDAAVPAGEDPGHQERCVLRPHLA